MIKEYSHNIPLTLSLAMCPQYWQNFIAYVQNMYSDDNETPNHVRNLLNNFDGRLYRATIDGDIELSIDYNEEVNGILGVQFVNAEDATAFILRWSA